MSEKAVPTLFGLPLGLVIAAFYGIVSIMITFFNKAVFATFEFKSANMLTLGQMLVAWAGLLLLRLFKFVEFPGFNRDFAMKVLPLCISFLLMVITGLGALKYLNIPMFSALRRLTTFMVIGGEFAILGKIIPGNEFFSICVMIGGATLAGFTDLTFSMIGYVLVFLNCLVTALYLVFIRKAGEATKMNSFGLMYYNNVISAPLMFVLVSFTGELHEFFEFEYISHPGFIICFLGSCFFALLLNFSVFLCTTYNSALVTSVTGQIKNILTTLVGLFAFGDVIFVGLFISTIGSLHYAFIKFQQQQARLNAKPEN